MAVFPSLLPEVELPVSHITPFVFRHVEELADKPALIDGPTGRTLTYGQLYGAILKTAGGLRARGFGKGDCMAIMAPNIPEYAIAFHAVAAVGGVVTTINPTYTAEEVEYQLNDAGAKYLLTIPLFIDVATEAASAAGVDEVFVFGEAEGATPFTALFDADPITEFAEVDPHEDVVVLPYSSGTTGLPKGVMLTHHNLTSNLAQAKHVLDIDADEMIIAVLPFFHIYGMQILMNGVLYSGATAVTMPRFDLEQFLSLLQEHRISKAYLVPPIILALA
ncbi:MAG: AMP-binding protein, partial [Acidimicrobiia bacterium]|nr:AMP-binding protein [Acidimicrobiia bacterium]